MREGAALLQGLATCGHCGRRLHTHYRGRSAYGGRYYSWHHGTWFFAAGPGGAWSILATERVPKPVLAVSTSYYKIPPRQAKKMGAQSFVPPGQAKQNKNH